MNQQVENMIEALIEEAQLTIEEAVHANHAALDKRRASGHSDSNAIRKNRSELAGQIHEKRQLRDSGRSKTNSAANATANALDNDARTDSQLGKGTPKPENGKEFMENPRATKESKNIPDNIYKAALKGSPRIVQSEHGKIPQPVKKKKSFFGN